MGAVLSNVLSIVFSTALWIGAGVLGGVVYSRFQDPPTKVVVVDMRRLVEPIATDPRLSEGERQRRLQLIGDAMRTSLEAHAGAGDIVLDASVVLRAPEAVYVKP